MMKKEQRWEIKLSAENARKDHYLKSRLEKVGEKFEAVRMEITVLKVEKNGFKALTDNFFWSMVILIVSLVVMIWLYKPSFAYFPSVNNIEQT